MRRVRQVEIVVGVRLRAGDRLVGAGKLVFLRLRAGHIRPLRTGYNSLYPLEDSSRSYCRETELHLNDRNVKYGYVRIILKVADWRSSANEGDAYGCVGSVGCT